MQVNKTSHNSMATNFSGTDFQQLNKSATNAPYYLSVVVNNRLEVTAKVAVESKEVYTGYSFIRDLKHKIIKSPGKTFEKSSFEVFDVEVIKQVPGYILAVNERIAKMQLYNTFHNSNAGYQYKGKNRGYASPTPEGNQKVVTGTKSLLGVQEPVDERFMKDVVMYYCTDVHKKALPAVEAVLNITQDSQSYGIPIQDYIDYFIQTTVFNIPLDNAILRELRIYNTAVPQYSLEEQYEIYG